MKGVFLKMVLPGCWIHEVYPGRQNSFSEPLAGQEERLRTLLREESVPEITTGTHCTFISLCPSANFSRACSLWDRAVRAPTGPAGWSHKGWHQGCSRPGGGLVETSALTWSITQGSGPYLIVCPGVCGEDWRHSWSQLEGIWPWHLGCRGGLCSSASSRARSSLSTPTAKNCLPRTSMVLRNFDLGQIK